MSAVREAIVLPLVFLTVVLASAVRPAAQVTLVPPPPGALVLALLVLALLVRSGTLAPDQLMHATRPALANVNGVIVLATLFFASAQLIAAVVPESGVAALLVWVVLLSLVVQAFAVAPDRTRLLRGLMVMFGAAYTLKFVLLTAWASPSSSRLASALRLIFDEVTLGAMSQRQMHTAEAYLVFAAMVLYLGALAALPAAGWRMVRAPHGSGQVRSLSRPAAGEIVEE
jgi:hypothetical protein